MPENGYIALYRSLLDSEIMSKPPEWFKLWTVILLKCNFEDRGIYKRGEFTTKYEYLASEAGVSVNVVDKFLRWAVSRNMVETHKLTRGVIITVIKYDDFQVKSETEAKQKRNRSGTINKRIIKELNKDTITPPTPQEGGEDKKEEDFIETGLKRIQDTKLREKLQVWHRYKAEEKKQKYKPIGWESLITQVLEYPPDFVCDRITEAMAGGWQGINLRTAQVGKQGPPARQSYFGLLDEWCEEIRVGARNEIRDHETSTRREASRDLIISLLNKNIIKYYRMPGKLSESQGQALEEMIQEYRQNKNLAAYEEVPASEKIIYLRKILKM